MTNVQKYQSDCEAVLHICEHIEKTLLDLLHFMLILYKIYGMRVQISSYSSVFVKVFRKPLLA